MEVETVCEGEEVLVAGWAPVARQHPRGRDGTVFVTIEGPRRVTRNSSSGPGSSPGAGRSWRAGRSLARGAVSRREGTASVIVSHVERIDARVPMPTAHDWH